MGNCGHERILDSVPVHFTSSSRMGKAVVPYSVALSISAPVEIDGRCIPPFQTGMK